MPSSGSSIRSTCLNGSSHDTNRPTPANGANAPFSALTPTNSMRPISCACCFAARNPPRFSLTGLGPPKPALTTKEFSSAKSWPTRPLRLDRSPLTRTSHTTPPRHASPASGGVTPTAARPLAALHHHHRCRYRRPDAHLMVVGARGRSRFARHRCRCASCRCDRIEGEDQDRAGDRRMTLRQQRLGHFLLEADLDGPRVAAEHHAKFAFAALDVEG